MKQTNIENAPQDITIEISPRIPDLPRASDGAIKPELIAFLNYTARDGMKMSRPYPISSDEDIAPDDSLTMTTEQHLDALLAKIKISILPLLTKE